MEIINVRDVDTWCMVMKAKTTPEKMKMKFRVDGIPVNTRGQANVLADRLFTRYKKTKTIEIIEVFWDGTASVIDYRLATRTNQKEDNDTLDMFK